MNYGGIGSRQLLFIQWLVQIIMTKYLFVCLVVLAILGATTVMVLQQPQPANAWIFIEGARTIKKAPPAVTGDNVYIVWFTDQGTTNSNGEVMFRASTDGGSTFTDKINLSNTTDTDSVDAEIDSDADSVIVTWWEVNQTSDTPVARVSNDNGETFGPVLQLATNGTIG
jgi:hypothetical protein